MRGSYPEGLKIALLLHYIFNKFIHILVVVYFIYTLKYQNTSQNNFQLISVKSLSVLKQVVL